MVLTHPNIIPADGLRLPDALTVKYGPAPLLSRFVLGGDLIAQQLGVKLRLRHDFEALVEVNRREVANGTWFPLINMFDPEYAELNPESAYWLSGEDENGNIVVTWAARVFYWPESALVDHVGLLLCEKRDQPAFCRTTPDTAEAMRRISGVVFWGGSLWIHPDRRHQRLSPLMGRLGRALALSRWPVDWIICLVEPKTVRSGLAAGYGYRHLAPGIEFPGSQFKSGLSLAYLSAEEAYEDFTEFMSAEFDHSSYDGSWAFEAGMRRLQTVTNTSPVAVDQGSINRSYRV